MKHPFGIKLESFNRRENPALFSVVTNIGDFEYPMKPIISIFQGF